MPKFSAALLIALNEERKVKRLSQKITQLLSEAASFVPTAKVDELKLIPLWNNTLLNIILWLECELL